MAPQEQNSQPVAVGTLTAAQSQYFSQLQQNNDMTKTYGAATQSSGQQQSYQQQSLCTAASAAAPTGYSAVAAQETQAQSAVTGGQAQHQHQGSELNSGIGYLDVQFGALDLIDANSTFDSTGSGVGMDGGGQTVSSTTVNASASKYANNLDAPGAASGGGGLDLGGGAVTGQAVVDAYSSTASKQAAGINSALAQGLSNSTDTSNSIQSATAAAAPASSDNFGSAYSSSTSRSTAPSSSTPASNTASSTVTGGTGTVDLTKQTAAAAAAVAADYATQSAVAAAAAASTFAAYQPKTQGYGAASYNNSQVSF
nr:unnamed protein product [Callosobruchus chinensis]